ncbi:unnamed protein product [marine sediment metagenome]|uniref:Uncharacterized protein n=1 Tax=marine sediment metagenome TaxID=412755 RepID=X1GZM8_9ZZZZ
MSIITGKTTMASWNYGHPMPVRTPASPVSRISFIITFLNRGTGIELSKRTTLIGVEKRSTDIGLQKRSADIELNKRKIEIEFKEEE